MQKNQNILLYRNYIFPHCTKEKDLGICIFSLVAFHTGYQQWLICEILEIHSVKKNIYIFMKRRNITVLVI